MIAMAESGAMTTHHSTASRVDIAEIRSILAANAAFSVASGGVLAIGGFWLETRLGPPGWSLTAVGVGVFIFGCLMRRGLRAAPRATITWVLPADVGWVLGVTALVSLAPSLFTTSGMVATAAVTSVVAWFALREWRATRAPFTGS